MIGIFSSTVKKNILFGEDYDPELFRRVIRATALEPVCLYDISYTNSCLLIVNNDYYRTLLNYQME